MEKVTQRKNENSNKMEEGSGRNFSRTSELLIIFSVAFTLFYSVFCIRDLQAQVKVIAIAHNKLLSDFNQLKDSCNYHRSNRLNQRNELDLPKNLLNFYNKEAFYSRHLEKREIFSKGEKSLKQLTDDNRLVKELKDPNENNTVVSVTDPNFEEENKTEISREDHHYKLRASTLSPIKFPPRPPTNSGHHGRKAIKERPLQKKFAAIVNEKAEPRHRDHADKPFKPVAVHYSASLSNHSLRHHPLHKGNGLVTLPSPLYQYWSAIPWLEDLNMTDSFSLEGSDFKVSKRGLYFLYAQIQYTTKKDHNGYKVFKNTEPIAQCIFTKTFDHPEPSVQTCSLTIVVALSPDDKIFIQDISHNPTVALSPEKSFFGLVLIAPT